MDQSNRFAEKNTRDEPDYFISVVEDIQARKETELALQRIYGSLEVKVEARTAELKRSNENLEVEISQRQQAEAVLKASEERLRTIIQSSHDAFIGLDSRGLITDWNDAAVKTFGWSAHEVIGLNLTNVVVPARYRDAHQKGLNRFVQTGTGSVINRRVELQALARSGEEFPVEITFTSYQINGAYYFGAFIHDISERRNAAQELEQKQQLLDAVLETIDVAVIACNGKGELTLFNRTARKFHGLAEQNVSPDQWAEHYDLFREDGKTPMTTEEFPLFRALQGERVHDVELMIAPKLLKPRSLLTSGRPLISSNGEKLGAVIAMHDISQRKEIEAQLRMLARVDTLTGLPNRRSFNEKLNEAALRSNRTGQPVALMFLDIDYFKSINDTFGHAGGDDVLKEYARRIKASVRETDTVSRLSGDEFTIILEGVKVPDEAALVARKILDAIQKPFKVQGDTVTVTTSIGVSFLKPGENDISTVTIEADKALYKAKAAGRNQIAVF